MFNSIFKGNIQGRKNPGRCAFAEPEMLSYRKPKLVVQNEKNGHTNPNNIHNYQNEIGGLYQRYPKANPVDCDGVQLTNAQSHMVPTSILWL